MLRIESGKKAKSRRQAGFIVTVELLLITVILVVGLVTGMTKLRDQTIAELGDTGSAIGAINQSWVVLGTTWFQGATQVIAATSGWEFDDTTDVAGDGTDGAVGGDGQRIAYNAAPVPDTTASAPNESDQTFP